METFLSWLLEHMVFDVWLGVTFTFVGVVAALAYENSGTARLLFRAEPTHTGIPHGPLRTRFLKVSLWNCPRKYPFVPRRTAYSCHGHIRILDLQGNLVCDPVPIRWDGVPQPLQTVVVNGNRLMQVANMEVIPQTRNIDVPADELHTFPIAFRLEDGADAYGFTSESYFYERWSKPEFRIPPGEYVAHVVVKSDDTTAETKFRFTNPPNYEQFDLVRVCDERELPPCNKG